MSYIHCPYGNHYEPNENLKNLFQELVIQPFENHPQTQAWEVEVRNKEEDYHRKTILLQGRTNFDESFNGLFPEDKVLLYCVYYMPMHLFSSYLIFLNHLPPVGDKVIFIDFGCGPLTSGIAFWAFAKPRDITYLGIDISQAMRYKAKDINQYGPDNHRNPFFRNGGLIRDYNKLPRLLGDYITERDQTQIIFNFCYVLASRTLNVNALSDILNQIAERYRKHNMTVVYQNPIPPQSLDLESSYLHRNWIILKNRL